MTLKQCSFGVDSKKQFCYYNVEKITVFERQNNVTLSTLNQRGSFTLRQRYFGLTLKNNYVLCHDVWKIKIFISTLKRWPYFNVETILSPVESCFIEIRALLPVTLQKELPQVRFLGISRTILFRGIFKPSQTSKRNVIAKIVFLNILTIFSKTFILDVLLSSEFFSALMNLLL